MKCPGQDTKYWKPGDIFEVPCPVCGESVEFFKDDSERRCKACGYKFRNPRLDLSCVEWCAYAKQCIGSFPEDMKEGERGKLLIINSVISAMKDVFKDKRERIAHSLRVFGYAKEILKREGGDFRVVLCSAILHDIGVKEAEKILLKLGLDELTIEHIKKIIADHRGAGIDMREGRIFWDSDWLVKIQDEHSKLSKWKLKELIDRVFKTVAGKEIAYNLYL